MPATVFPCPITQKQFRLNFAGLGDLLEELSEFTGDTEQEVMERHARQAMGQLERVTGMPFFNTRFCTRELASQLSLTLGEDFDRYASPEDYDVTQWTVNTGAQQVAKTPLNAVTLVRFSTANDGQLLDIPDAWINRDDWHGVLHFYPAAGQSIAITYRLGSMTSIRRAGGAAGNVPLLIHLRYQAGLVGVPFDELDAFDPSTAEEQTDWSPELVTEYQLQIAALAAAEVLERAATILSNGGAQISFDGLSEGVDHQILALKAQRLREGALRWGQEARQGVRGIPIAFA